MKQKHRIDGKWSNRSYYLSHYLKSNKNLLIDKGALFLSANSALITLIITWWLTEDVARVEKCMSSKRLFSTSMSLLNSLYSSVLVIRISFGVKLGHVYKKMPIYIIFCSLWIHQYQRHGYLEYLHLIARTINSSYV